MKPFSFFPPWIWLPTYTRNNKSLSIPTVNAGWPHNEYNDYKRVGAGAADFDAHTCLADFARESREYIKRQASDKDNPFFLYVPLTSSPYSVYTR